MLDVFFIGITMLAEPALWVVVLAWIYWNSDKTAGRFISYAMFTSLCFGNGLKEIFRMPRPIGEPGIRTIYADTATGYSFPSGHSQMMATVGSAIPLWYRKNSLWYFFIPLMFLVAFSRMYLGVHYPRDVFVGLLLGVGISWLCAKLWDRALGHSGLFAATFGLMSIFLFVARSHDFLQLYGLFGGFAAGCAYLNGEELHLTPIEYKLLCLLSRNVGKVLTHTYITQNIWGSSWDNDIASLRVFMATLRKKLEKNEDSTQYIQTHIGVGYRMMKVE